MTDTAVDYSRVLERITAFGPAIVSAYKQVLREAGDIAAEKVLQGRALDEALRHGMSEARRRRIDNKPLLSRPSSSSIVIPFKRPHG